MPEEYDLTQPLSPEQLKEMMKSEIMTLMVHSFADMAILFYERIKDQSNMSQDQAVVVTAAFMQSPIVKDM